MVSCPYVVGINMRDTQAPVCGGVSGYGETSADVWASATHERCTSGGGG